MTENLALWKADADAKGIPENIQRGLAFFIGIYFGAYGFSVPKSESDLVLQRIHPSLPDIPDGVGGQFYDHTIAGLLRELAQKLDPEFSPREIVYKDVTFPAIPSLSEERLPDLNSLNLQLLADSTQLAKSLLGQIGDCINDETEDGWVISGILFFTAYGQTDNKNTVQMCKNVFDILPPHMRFMYACFLVDSDSEILKETAFRLTKSAALVDVGAHTIYLLEEFYTNFSAMDLYRVPNYHGQLFNPEILRNLRKFCVEGLIAARAFVYFGYYSDLCAASEQELLQQPYQKTYSDDSVLGPQELIEDLKNATGYQDFDSESSTLSLGELMDCASKVLLACISDAVLNRKRRGEIRPDQTTVEALFILDKHLKFAIENERRLKELEEILAARKKLS